MKNLVFFYIFLFVFWAENVLNFKLSPLTGLSYFNIALYLMLLGWFATSFQNRKLIEPNRLNKYFFMLFMIFVFSIPVKFIRAEVPNLNIFDEMVFLKGVLNPFFLFFYLYSCIGKEKYCRWAIAGLVIFIIITVFSSIGVSTGIMAIGEIKVTKGGRTAGFVEKNQYAAILVLFIPLLISHTIYSNKKPIKIFFIGILLLSFISLLMTGSRGGVIAFMFSVAIYSFLFIKHSMINVRKMMPLVLFFIPILITLAFLFSPDHVKEGVVQRFDPTSAEDVQQYTSGRTMIWPNGLKLFLESPVVGHGQGTFVNLSKIKFGMIFNSHNDYLLYLVHYGVFGLSLFLIILCLIYRQTSIIARESDDKNLKILALNYLSGLTGYAVAMFGVNIIQPQMLFWAYTALVLKCGYLHFKKRNMLEVLWR